MPLLGFQKQFAPLVESGEKRQTIRAYRKDGRDPKRGDRLYLYTGLRTKQCRKLGESVCVAVERIGIPSGRDYIRFPDRVEEWQQTWGGVVDEHYLATDDGFESSREMRDWFVKTHGLPFEGLLIRWGEIER